MYLLQVFRFIPFSILYVLSDALAFVLYRVVGYRKAVIISNLERAFPEKTAAERRKIMSDNYRNLTDVTLETLKSFSASMSEIERRAVCINPELANQYLDRGQSIILTGCHLANWEYSGLVLPPVLRADTILVYKPLTNKKMDDYINQARCKTGAKTLAMNEVVRALRSNTTSALVLLSDQSPSSRKSAHWVDFFGQTTASLPGADIFGRKFDLPVLYYRVQRTSRRGFYEIEFFEICIDPSAAVEKDITQAYARRLESDIREKPAQWLWSHKRWKMNPE